MKPDFKIAPAGFKSGWEGIVLILGVGLWLLLLGLVVWSPRDLIYDELYHLASVERVLNDGLVSALVSPTNSSAVGPLYPVLHTFLQPLTGLEAPWVRFPSVALLGATLLLLVKLNRQLKVPHGAVAALLLLAVPMLWPLGGMAVTEVPALFFFTWAVLWALRLHGKMEERWEAALPSALMTGVLFSLACLGRQTYLAGLIAFPLLAARFERRQVALVLVAMAPVALSMAWLFYVWGGFVPTSMQAESLRMDFGYGILSLSYLGIATLFISPRWLIFQSRRVFIFAGLAMAVAFCFPPFALMPARTLAASLLPGALLGLYGRACVVIFTGIAALCATGLIAQTWELRKKRDWLFVHVVVWVMALTPIAMPHQFSSRYAMMALTLLVPAVCREKTEYGFFDVARLVAGALAGVGILISYYRV